MNAPKFITLLLTLSLLTATISPAAPPDDTPIKFNGVTFLPRWAENGQHEFTPKGQEDLDHWTEMITLVILNSGQDEEGLASAANNILEHYKKNGASIVKTGSVPKTEDKPAEHLIIAFFKQPDFIEAAFARFVIVDQTALAFIYAHREYGENAGEKMNAWRKKNGVASETLLMNQKDIPVPDAGEALKKKLF